MEVIKVSILFIFIIFRDQTKFWSSFAFGQNSHYSKNFDFGKLKVQNQKETFDFISVNFVQILAKTAVKLLNCCLLLWNGVIVIYLL